MVSREDYRVIRPSRWESPHINDFVTEVISGLPLTLDYTEDEENERQPLLRRRISEFVNRRCTANVMVLSVLAFILISGLVIGISLSIDSQDNVPDLMLMSQDSWNASEPNKKQLIKFDSIPTYVVVTQTATKECLDVDNCIKCVKNQQDMYLMYHYPDIIYNFLIGGDGRVYEGRGWDIQGFLQDNFNNKSIGIAFIGTFTDVAPTKIQLVSYEKLIEIGIKKSKITRDFKLVAIDQVTTSTQTAGKHLIDAVKLLTHWYNCTMFTCR